MYHLVFQSIILIDMYLYIVRPCIPYSCESTFGVLVMDISKWGTNNDLVERCSQVRTTLPVEPKNWGLWGGFYYA